jgi:carbonic anhydrase
MCQVCAEGGLSRRHFLRGSLALSALAGAGTLPAFAQDAPPNAIGGDEALKRIMDGNGRYAANVSANKDYSVGRAARASAQYPIAGIVSCADSRLAPEVVFDQGPGELFVVRLAGNFVDDDGLASLEYGVAVLGMPLIMVLGHSNCGAVSATIKVIQEGTKLPGHLPDLVASLKPGVERALAQKPENPLAAATAENVRYNVEVLKAATPIVAEAASAGKLKIVGGVYDIGTGAVTLI